MVLINLFLVTWSSELIAERTRRAAIADGPPNPDVRSLDSPADAGRWRTRTAAFDQLHERGTEVLVLFGEQEALYQEFARQGLLDQLGRWPNLRLERIPVARSDVPGAVAPAARA